LKASRRERRTKENSIDDFIPQSYNDNANEKLHILWRKHKWKERKKACYGCLEMFLNGDGWR
jgi:hypothetical protein